MRRARRIIERALLLAGLVTIPATGVPAAPPGILQIGIGPEPETLDPHRGVDIGAARVLMELCEGLLTRNGAGEIVAGAAHDWTVSADGLTWTFSLRPDGRWWNGEPVTAADFVRGWQRAVDPATRSGIADLLDGVANAAAIHRGTLPAAQLGIEAPSPLRLVVRLERPMPDLKMALAHRISLPVHGPTLAAAGDDFAKPGTLMCNGPYRLAEHRLHDSYRLVRSPHYHGAAAVAVPELRLIVSDQAETEVAMFRAGQLDVTSTVPAAMLEWTQAAMPRQLRIHAWTSLSYLQANPADPSWQDNPAFLEALATAIDPAKLRAAGNGPPPIVAHGLVAPDLWSDAAAAPVTARGDAVKARQALTQAGYGRTVRPPPVSLNFANVETARQRAVAIAAQWKQVLDVETELLSHDPRMLMAQRRAGNFRGFILNTSIGYSPHQMLLIFQPAGKPITALDTAGQEAEMRAWERQILESRRIIPLTFGRSQHLVADRVRGWQDNIYDLHPARTLSVAP